MSCNICQKLQGLLENPASSEKIDCGPVQDAVKTTCPDHGPLLRAFYDTFRGDENHEERSKDVGFIGGGQGRSLHLTQSITKLGRYWDLLFVRSQQQSDHRGVGRVLDEDWVDLKIAKKWKDECLIRHGETCHNPLKVWPVRPTWLVDTELMCVVSGDNDAQYVALSYRWGTGSEIRLAEHTLKRLQQSQSLKDPDVMAAFPPIVRHAIHVTRQMGERFLWIDSLCIPQGDIIKLNAELNMMSAIFANAVFTIIAADEDAHTGIVGLEGVSPSRKLGQKVFSFGQDQIIVRKTGIFSMTTGTQYYKRGWTYQEFEMSKRRLLFRSGEVHWECSHSSWHEDLVLGAETDKYINPRLRVIMSGFPDITSLNHGITGYNERELTFDEDALAGILGMLSVFSRTFTGGFLYGLAEMHFEHALCWMPHWDHTDLRRRAASNRSDNERVSSFALPSWSWVGWQGLVRWSYVAQRVNPRVSWFTETIPTTQWYTWDVATKRPLRRVMSQSSETLDKHKIASEPLPKGWTRHDVAAAGNFRDEPLLTPGGCGEYVYKHENMPDEDCQYWFYPFPVPEIKSTTEPQMPEQTPHICCRTQRAKVRACRDPSSKHKKIDLRNSAGNSIGSMELHNHDQLGHFQADGLEVNDGDEPMIEVVAICRTRRYSKEFDSEKRIFARINNPRNMYQILWVEWDDGIAYRLAGGTIDKVSWEELELEDVELVLG